MSIARKAAWVATMVRSSFGNDNPKGYRERELDDTHMGNNRDREIAITWKRQVICEVLYLLNCRSRKNRLGISERKKLVMRMSRTAINARSLPSVKKTFIPVDKRWYRTYVMHTLGSLGHCLIGQNLDNCDNQMLGDLKKCYKACAKVEKKRVVVPSKDRKDVLRIIVTITVFKCKCRAQICRVF